MIASYIISCYILKLITKLYNLMSTDTLTLNNIGYAREVFYDKVVFFTTGYALVVIGDAPRNRALTILM